MVKVLDSTILFAYTPLIYTNSQEIKERNVKYGEMSGWRTDFESNCCCMNSMRCHGPSLDDDKAPAMGDGSSLDDKTPVTVPAATPAATSIAKLPTVAIGKHDLSFESHSIQDLDVLADVELLWDVRGEGAETRQRERG